MVDDLKNILGNQISWLNPADIETVTVLNCLLYTSGKREPYCYQSYPMQFGYSDRYYDDNDWLAIDLCDYYALTKDPAVLRCV